MLIENLSLGTTRLGDTQTEVVISADMDGVPIYQTTVVNSSLMRDMAFMERLVERNVKQLGAKIAEKLFQEQKYEAPRMLALDSNRASNAFARKVLMDYGSEASDELEKN